ncbi:hypothetical protein L6452_38508 [Arctium lappa]|uniref:Uncharacterized protein n=1 Tax=Arctium lappa TaxID=4217 RepID=A0ACB8XPA3_ARCLA|nr:hypothetical protein L6452_38508 [Arctium lappa]
MDPNKFFVSRRVQFLQMLMWEQFGKKMISYGSINTRFGVMANKKTTPMHGARTIMGFHKFSQKSKQNKNTRKSNLPKLPTTLK